MAVPEELLKGPVATVFAFEELPATVKVVLEYAKEAPILVAKGGVQGEAVITEAQLKPISELPSLDTLRAELVGMTVMPMQSLMALLEEPGRQFVGVIKAGSETLVNVLAAYVRKEDAA